MSFLTSRMAPIVTVSGMPAICVNGIFTLGASQNLPLLHVAEPAANCFLVIVRIETMDDSSLFSGNERKNKEREMLRAGRLPPGQCLTLKWPVLHYGSVPKFDPARWDFRVWGLVGSPIKLSWEEFNRLPVVHTHSDFHCVTRWSRF